LVQKPLMHYLLIFELNLLEMANLLQQNLNLGVLNHQDLLEDTTRRKGTKSHLFPTPQIFKNYKYRNEYVARMLKNYVYLNPGLTISFNGEKFFSENGLKDLLEDNSKARRSTYPIIHLQRSDDIEVALTHSKTQYSEEYHSLLMVKIQLKEGPTWPLLEKHL